MLRLWVWEKRIGLLGPFSCARNTTSHRYYLGWCGILRFPFIIHFGYNWEIIQLGMTPDTVYTPLSDTESGQVTLKHTAEFTLVDSEYLRRDSFLRYCHADGTPGNVVAQFCSKSFRAQIMAMWLRTHRVTTRREGRTKIHKLCQREKV